MLIKTLLQTKSQTNQIFITETSVFDCVKLNQNHNSSNYEAMQMIQTTVANPTCIDMQTSVQYPSLPKRLQILAERLGNSSSFCSNIK
ncbi:hypothetical protein VNO80_26003 [Phaseolus coccineus]|uniref:Uncharacterized protein n=1 Tax=Phaseolus coccineus TaxID=3886 RepID=A0AAN9QQL3_PHACN